MPKVVKVQTHARRRPGAQSKPAASSAPGLVNGQRVRVLSGDYGNATGRVVSVGGEKAGVLLDNCIQAGPRDISLDNLVAL